MPSTYTQNIGLEKPATGEQAGGWGNTANTSYDSIDASVDGSLSIPLSASSFQLTTNPGVPSQGHNKVILWTGALVAATTVNILPNTAQKLYLMQNNTTGNFPINFQQGSGGGFLLQPGYSAIIYTDGGGNGAQVRGALDNPQFASALIGNLTVTGTATFNLALTFAQPTTFTGAVTMNAATVGPLTISSPGYPAAAYDLFFRDPAGIVAPLGIGAVGQVLEVSASRTLSWVTQSSIGIGSVIGGSIAGGIYFSSGGNVLTQDGNILASVGMGIGLGGAPGHSLHIGRGLAPEMWLDTSNPNAAQQRSICLATNGVQRWLLYSPQAAETGGNVGSNLNLVAYNDGASAALEILSAFRATGNVTIGAYADYSASLAVIGNANSAETMLVRAAAGQPYLQVWQSNTGGVIAYLDSSGNLNITGNLSSAGSNFLSLSMPSGRLDLHGTVPQHPWGAIHVGREPSTTTGVSGITGAIAMETAGNATDVPPAGVMRFYYRNNCFVIQFTSAGAAYYAYLPLAPTTFGQAQWYISQNPQ